MPAFSEIDARGERGKLIEGYTRGTKYLALIAVPLFTFIIVSAHQIMMVWMGPGYGKSVVIIQILGVGWLCAVLAGLRAVIVQAIAKPEMEMKAGLVFTILNIPLSIIFIIKFGFTGVALGTSIALFFSATYALVKLHQEIRFPLWRFIKTTILRTLAICIVIGLALLGLTNILQGVLFESSRIASLIVLVTQAILFFGIYIIFLQYIKPFDFIDVILLKERLPFLQHLITRFSQGTAKGTK
jgi:O-antigen/teichoic acid export membrane protein